MLDARNTSTILSQVRLNFQSDIDCQAVAWHKTGRYSASVCSDTGSSQGFIVVVSHLSMDPVIAEVAYTDNIFVESATMEGDYLIVFQGGTNQNFLSYKIDFLADEIVTPIARYGASDFGLKSWMITDFSTQSHEGEETGFDIMMTDEFFGLRLIKFVTVDSVTYTSISRKDLMLPGLADTSTFVGVGISSGAGVSKDFHCVIATSNFQIYEVSYATALVVERIYQPIGNFKLFPGLEIQGDYFSVFAYPPTRSNEQQGMYVIYDRDNYDYPIPPTPPTKDDEILTILPLGLGPRFSRDIILSGNNKFSSFMTYDTANDKGKFYAHSWMGAGKITEYSLNHNATITFTDSDLGSDSFDFIAHSLSGNSTVTLGFDNKLGGSSSKLWLWILLGVLVVIVIIAIIIVAVKKMGKDDTDGLGEPLNLDDEECLCSDRDDPNHTHHK